MTTGIIHYLLQWWNYKVEGTLPFKCLNLSVFRHVEDAVLETSSPSLPSQNNNKKPTTNNNKPQKDETLQGERRASAHAHNLRGRLLSFPSSL